MAGDTTITIIGNLTDDPELRFTPSGAAVAKFTVASTPRYMDKASQQWKDGTPIFMACSIWRDPAEHAAETLLRGMRVIVVGRLTQENWEDKNGGGKRSRIVLTVDEVGPALKYATAKVAKAAKSEGGQPSGGFGSGGSTDDPWAGQGGGRASAGSFDDEPPF